ncbi:MAG: hypothetical protein K8I01_09775 [Candidatus Methylomirabilis sp.]|nr:hypothetical protein [Deltaproteobacteria bacterium]
MKKIISLLMLIAFFASATGAYAEDAMQRTLRDSIYGGLIGGLLGTAVMFLTDDPGDHIEYIPTGAAVGVLVGAAYGIGRSMQDSSFAEVEKDGTIKLGLPVVKAQKLYDEKLDMVEKIESIDLVRIKF